MAHTTPRPSRARSAALAVGLALLAASAPTRAEAIDPLIGALMPMAARPAGSHCPNGWLPAMGQILSIQGNPALFALLGITYGGDGITTFALPDLRDRTPVGLGQGPGLSLLSWGEQGGNQQTNLTTANLPLHDLVAATTAAATHATPDPTRMLAQAQNAGLYASSGTPVTQIQSGPAGQSASIPTQSPYLAIVWCIATSGVYPSRP